MHMLVRDLEFPNNSQSQVTKAVIKQRVGFIKHNVRQPRQVVEFYTAQTQS